MSLEVHVVAVLANEQRSPQVARHRRREEPHLLTVPLVRSDILFADRVEITVSILSHRVKELQNRLLMCNQGKLIVASHLETNPPEVQPSMDSRPIGLRPADLMDSLAEPHLSDPFGTKPTPRGAFSPNAQPRRIFVRRILDSSSEISQQCEKYDFKAIPFPAVCNALFPAVRHGKNLDPTTQTDSVSVPESDGMSLLLLARRQIRQARAASAACIRNLPTSADRRKAFAVGRGPDSCIPNFAVTNQKLPRIKRVTALPNSSTAKAK